MSKLIGYARVSTSGQELNLQIDALKKIGCEKKNIFTDVVSGSKTDRPGLNECLETLQSGDTLVVWRLDRLGRSMSHLVSTIENLIAKKIGFKSISDGHIDTTTASGELIFNIFSSLAQFERRLIQERTKSGLEAARARGRVGGRKPISKYNSKVLAAQKLHHDKSMPIENICKELQISKPTLYRYLKLK
ncbi:MAG: recombinase family protein [Alphaproteobacteria bacterium]|nr:recombinase family protein [Alphaproteobacteria bacterium]